MVLGLHAARRAAATFTTTPPTPDELTRRQGIVGVVDYVAMTAQISIGGSANLVTARWLGPYVPVYLDGVWLLLSDGDPLILGPTGPARPLGAQVRRIATQSITNSSWQSIAWQDDYAGARDRGGLWAASPNPTRVTFPIAGRWLTILNVAWDTNATGNRFARFLQNGATSIGGTSGPATINGFTHYQPTLTRELIVAAGDYVEAQVWQDSGASRTLNVVNDQPQMSTTYLGDY